MDETDTLGNHSSHQTTQLRIVVPTRTEIAYSPAYTAIDAVITAFDDAGVDACTTSFAEHIPNIHDTLQHQKRVALLTYELSRFYPDKATGLPNSLSDRQRAILYCAADRHDIGKLNCDFDILYVTGSFNTALPHEIKVHADYSYEALLAKDISFFNAILEKAIREDGLDLKLLDDGDTAAIQEIALAAKHHHEHYDGSGYPSGLAGKEIPLLSRIIAVADTYDAVHSERCYKQGRSRKDTLQLMYEKDRKLLDPYALDMLIHLKATPEIMVTLFPRSQGAGAHTTMVSYGKWPELDSDSPHRSETHAHLRKWPTATP